MARIPSFHHSYIDLVHLNSNRFFSIYHKLHLKNWFSISFALLPTVLQTLWTLCFCQLNLLFDSSIDKFFCEKQKLSFPVAISVKFVWSLTAVKSKLEYMLLMSLFRIVMFLLRTHERSHILQKTIWTNCFANTKLKRKTLILIGVFLKNILRKIKRVYIAYTYTFKEKTINDYTYTQTSIHLQNIQSYKLVNNKKTYTLLYRLQTYTYIYKI